VWQNAIMLRAFIAHRTPDASSNAIRHREVFQLPIIIFDRFGCQLLLVRDGEDAIVSAAGSEPDWHPVRSLGIIVRRKVFGTI